MTFSDDDISRFKDVLDTRKPWIEARPEVIRALLARLKAAEAVLTCSNEPIKCLEAYTKWKKSAGK